MVHSPLHRLVLETEGKTRRVLFQHNRFLSVPVFLLSTCDMQSRITSSSQVLLFLWGDNQQLSSPDTCETEMLLLVKSMSAEQKQNSAVFLSARNTWRPATTVAESGFRCAVGQAGQRTHLWNQIRTRACRVVPKQTTLTDCNLHVSKHIVNDCSHLSSPVGLIWIKCWNLRLSKGRTDSGHLKSWFRWEQISVLIRTADSDGMKLPQVPSFWWT